MKTKLGLKVPYNFSKYTCASDNHKIWIIGVDPSLCDSQKKKKKKEKKKKQTAGTCFKLNLAF